MPQFDQVSVIKKANVYFDGKCVSHTVLFADGSRKTVGIIFPSQLVFNTAAPETMEIVSGACKVKLSEENEWKRATGREILLRCRATVASQSKRLNRWIMSAISVDFPLAGEGCSDHGKFEERNLQ